MNLEKRDRKVDTVASSKRAKGNFKIMILNDLIL